MAMAITEQPPATRRFTADEVWRMLEAGVLHPDEPYELIDGQLRYVSPQSPRHAGIILRLTELLTAAYRPDFAVRVQLPLGGIADQIPEPDIAITRRPETIDAAHPHAGETLLLIEVSESSVAWDVRKGAIYAAAGAPVFWQVMASRGVAVVHRDPHPDGSWGHVAEADFAAMLVLPCLEAVLSVDRIFTAGA